MTRRLAVSGRTPPVRPIVTASTSKVGRWSRAASACRGGTASRHPTRSRAPPRAVRSRPRPLVVELHTEMGCRCARSPACADEVRPGGHRRRPRSSNRPRRRASTGNSMRSGRSATRRWSRCDETGWRVRQSTGCGRSSPRIPPLRHLPRSRVRRPGGHRARGPTAPASRSWRRPTGFVTQGAPHVGPERFAAPSCLNLFSVALERSTPQSWGERSGRSPASATSVSAKRRGELTPDTVLATRRTDRGRSRSRRTRDHAPDR